VDIEFVNRVVEFFIATDSAHPDIIVSLLAVLFVAHAAIVFEELALVPLRNLHTHVKPVLSWRLLVVPAAGLAACRVMSLPWQASHSLVLLFGRFTVLHNSRIQIDAVKAL